MALKFYNTNRIEVEDAETAVVTSHNGVLGQSVDTLVYIRNDDPHLYFTTVQVWAEDTVSPDSTLGVYGNGWGVKLSSGARQPTPDEWEGVLAGDSIVIPDIGVTEQADTSNYHPFWIKVTTPGNLPAQTKDSIRLRYRAISYVVGS